VLSPTVTNRKSMRESSVIVKPEATHIRYGIRRDIRDKSQERPQWGT
jgi:hypothetical protein